MKKESKVALVTGAASGLGESIAQRLAADGMVVVVSDIDMANAGRVAKALNEGSISLRLDVTQHCTQDFYIYSGQPFLGFLEIRCSSMAGIAD